jgi:Na+-transporting NADH:ubiquinone oxidoreductase subunit NqrB
MAALFFWAAAGVAGLTVLIHVVLGGAKFVQPFMAVEMEPGLKWMAYLMWHLGTVSTLFILAGFAAGALGPAHSAYAALATAGAAGFVTVALFTAVKSGLSPRRFPLIPMFSLVTGLGLAGLFL